MPNVAPNAPILTYPISSAVIDYAIAQRFTWSFSDPDAGDTQSQYSFRHRVIGAGSWTTVAVVTANSFKDFTASALSVGSYEWQVSTYDALGLVGPYSSSEFFTAAGSPATPTITAPTVGGSVSNSATLTWSAPNQSAYQVRRVADSGGSPDTATVYFDSGEVTNASSRSVVVAYETNNRYEHVQLRVKFSGLWSSWATARVLVSFTSADPGIVDLVADSMTGSLVVTMTPAAVVGGKPSPVSVDVYVRDARIRGYGDRMATGRTPAGIWRWWTPASGVDYSVRTLTLASNGTTVWSAFEYPVLETGGTPSTVHTLINSGGTPSTSHTLTQDGGTP